MRWDSAQGRSLKIGLKMSTCAHTAEQEELKVAWHAAANSPSVLSMLGVKERALKRVQLEIADGGRRAERRYRAVPLSTDSALRLRTLPVYFGIEVL